MRGGVMRNYKYAKMILDRRATDTENINLASQGLPPAPSAGIELSEVDSRNMELDNLLTNISDAIEQESFSSLTINELKNVPRLLIYLSTSMDENRLVELLRYIEAMSNALDTLYDNANDTNIRKNAERIFLYLQDYKKYLTEFAEYVNSSPQDKNAAAMSIGKRVFKLKRQLEEAQPAPVTAPLPSPEILPEMPEGPEEPETPEEGKEEAPVPPRIVRIKRPTIAGQTEESRAAPAPTPTPRRGHTSTVRTYEEENNDLKDQFLAAYRRKNLAEMNSLVDAMKKPSSGRKLLAAHIDDII
jgi:hypothetical protein